MKVKIYKYDEIETIKELSNKKVGLFYILLVYFILLVCISGLIWSYFGKLDLKIKGIGSLETKIDNSIIINTVVGKINEIENDSFFIEKNYLEKNLSEKKNLYNAIIGKNYSKDIAVLNYITKKNVHKSELESLSIEIEEQEKIVYSNSEIYKIGGISKFEYEKSKNQLFLLNEKKKKLSMEYQIMLNNEKIALTDEIKELEMKIESINNNIKDTKLLAAISGYLEIIVPINNGDTVASGITVAKIIPIENEYKINIYVEEKDIIKIKKGNSINYHLNFPDEKKNISLKGKVEIISKDAITKEDGNKYYLVVGNIESKNVEKLNLKKGMTLESSIIYTKKRIIDYILENLSFKVKTLN